MLTQSPVNPPQKNRLRHSLLLLGLGVLSLAGCASMRQAMAQQAVAQAVDQDGTMQEWAPLRQMIVRQVTDPARPTTPTMEMFYLTALAGDGELMNLLAERGDINGLDPASESSALSVAVLDGQTTAVQCLLAAGADPDRYSPAAGATPLLDAVNLNDAAMVRLLLEHDADPDLAQSSLQNAPVHAAAQEGPPEIMAMLLEHDANPNARNTLGITPLMIAIQMGRVESVRQLLTAGADPELASEKGTTAQTVAERKSDPAILALLAEARKKKAR